ncbi:sugar ABC transporter permease, partial [mine drainage metagenome]
MFIPVITSWVVVSYVFAYIFAAEGGVANAVVSPFVGHTVHIDWLANTWTANAVIWMVSIWKGVGWSFIMFLAALDGVPRDLVESSRVDGANERRVWRHVVIPNIRPTLMFVSVLLVIGAVQVFTQVYILTAGGPFGSTSVLMTDAY